MADTNNLTQFLTDVAGAIKEKTGKEELIPASNFDEEIRNIQTKENLDVVLNEQDQLITSQETSVDDLLIVLNNKAKANNIKLNVFLQEEEPSLKEGIWLQNSDLTFDNIAVDENIVAQEEWDTLHSYIPIPYSFYDGSAVAIGTDIYLLGGRSSKNVYKYDTLSDSYTKMTDIPYSFYDGSAVAIGTDIYLLGGNGYTATMKYMYKYDTLSDKYTRLADIPYSFYNGSAVAIGTDIYLLGSTATSSAYKYDTLSDKYTQLTNIPYSFSDGSAVAIGTDIYLFGGSGNALYMKYMYKYDTLSDKYTRLADIPYFFCDGSAVAIGTDIYLFGSSYSANSSAYKYDILSNKYTQLADSPYSFYDGSAVAISTDIYLFGGSGKKTTVQVMNLISKDYPNNSIVISQGGYDKKTQLLGHANITGRLLQYFRDVWHYTTEGKLNKTIPTYYGDGTKWIKFKN